MHNDTLQQVPPVYPKHSTTESTPQAMRKPYNSVLHAIGNTPMVALAVASQGTLYAKLEYLNPGGSLKDRSALFMIEHAEQAGLLKPGGIIIDASSGNQGIATAMIGAIKGYKVIITVSEKISKEKMDAIRSYGAQVIVCPAKECIQDPEHYHSQAVTLHKNTPNSYMPNQYFSTLNAQAHYKSLGPEIWQQTNGTITHFIVGAGTCGTVSGAGRYLKEQNSAIKVIALDAQTSYRATGGNPKPYKVEGIGIDWDTPMLDLNVIDEVVPVSDENAFAMLKTLAHQYGILAGPSSGAVAWAGFEYAKQLKPTDVAVMIFGDSGRAYLSKNLYI
jgi:cystathionine beta-synthase